MTAQWHNTPQFPVKHKVYFYASLLATTEVTISPHPGLLTTKALVADIKEDEKKAMGAGGPGGPGGMGGMY